MNSLFTQHVWLKHSISFRDKFLNMWRVVAKNIYKSALTPKPGPLGGSVREVNPPAGSHEKRPLLLKQNVVQCTYKSGFPQVSKINQKKCNWFLVVSSMYLGPGGGTLPALSSSIISSMSLGVRSSWEKKKQTVELGSIRRKQNSADQFFTSTCTSTSRSECRRLELQLLQ